MTVKVQRKSDSDTNDKMISRFKKSMREARYWITLRKERYFKKDPAARLKKARAIKRENYRKENAKKELYSA